MSAAATRGDIMWTHTHSTGELLMLEAFILFHYLCRNNAGSSNSREWWGENTSLRTLQKWVPC